MSAEDYDDVPGLGAMDGRYKGPPMPPRTWQCFNCRHPITFKQRKPVNEDGTPHRCLGKGADASSGPKQKATDNHAATLFAMSAMNAIISAQIQKYGGDYLHHMNFHDVADASWQAAAAMVSAEKNYRDEFTGF